MFTFSSVLNLQEIALRPTAYQPVKISLYANNCSCTIFPLTTEWADLAIGMGVAPRRFNVSIQELQPNDLSNTIDSNAKHETAAEMIERLLLGIAKFPCYCCPAVQYLCVRCKIIEMLQGVVE